jgi:hypothetical protein
MELLFSEKLPEAIRKEFTDKVRLICSKLPGNPDPNNLMLVMNNETGGTFRPSIVNSIGATGLIQFTKETAAWLVTSGPALASMSAVAQLDYVYKYYKAIAGKTPINNAFDLYMLTFYPYALNKPDDYVLGSEKSVAYSQKVGVQNKGFDLNRDGVITKAEFRNWLIKRYPDQTAWFKKKELLS